LQDIIRADKDEAAMARLGTLPHDPLRDLAKGEEINLPYTAFCYLIRRLTVRCSFLPSFASPLPSLYSPVSSLPDTFADSALQLCTRYCLVCHNKLTAEFEALKPYVCDRPLCTYQYYAHNRGASLEVRLCLIRFLSCGEEVWTRVSFHLLWTYALVHLPLHFRSL
jgi:ubiquitin-conjugating enzyme E2 Q